MKQKIFKIMKKIIAYKRESTEEISMVELKEMQQQNDNLVLLDVRSPQEYQEGHLKNSILIPNYELKEKAEKILPDKNVVIIAYCQSGNRSKKVVKILKGLGYEQVYSLIGGING